MLNADKIGRPLAKVVGGDRDGAIISVSDKFNDKDAKTESKSFKICHEGIFQQIPDTTKEREIIYITGCSGSGKSTYTRKFIEQHKKNNPDIEIYLFSALPDDESLDSVEPKRIILDDTIISDPIDVKEFSGCIVIFDDIDVLTNKKIREEVYKILNQILEIGRHYKINCIVTNHLPTNGRDTRRILNESSCFVYFPHSANAKIKYFLTEYVGIDKKMISKLKRQQSRWVCLYKNYPMVYLTERQIGLVNAIDDD